MSRSLAWPRPDPDAPPSQRDVRPPPMRQIARRARPVGDFRPVFEIQPRRVALRRSLAPTSGKAADSELALDGE